MKNLAFATIDELQALVRSKEISPEELTSFFLDRIAQHDNKINAVLEAFDRESILQDFQAQGTLAGIPGLVKNNICIRGRRTTCASRILENYHAPYDATAIKRLKSAGALMLGAANLDEFAMGSSTETSAFKKTKNPWDVSRVPGGSSGGSAAAVAAGFVPWALGSDTGGSVRQPAAFCNVVGMKPTYGLVSRYGLIAYGSSLDQIGVFSRTVSDNAKILSVISGKDEADSSSIQQSPKDYTTSLGNFPAGLRIGVVRNALHAEGMDNEIVAAIEKSISIFEQLGATIEQVNLSHLKYAAAAYFIISRAEAASNLARFDGVKYGLRTQGQTLGAMYDQTRHDGFGDEVRVRILVGNYVLSRGYADKFYDKAKVVRDMIRQEFLEVFKSVDLLIIPTHPAPAFVLGAFDVDKLQMDLQDYFTCAMNLAGIPAMTIPCGFTSAQLPIGFQLVGPHLAEELIYRTAYAHEQKTDWHHRHPAGF